MIESPLRPGRLMVFVLILFVLNKKTGSAIILDGINVDMIDAFPTLAPSESPVPSTIPSIAPSTLPSDLPSSTFGTDVSSTVTFYVIGDVPYSDFEACMIPYELEKLDPSASFLVHLGDARDGKPDPKTGQPRDCPESMFQNLATIFENSALPTFFLPGDNAWLDCADTKEAYEYWEKYLFSYNERVDQPVLPATVNRWDTFPVGVDRTSRRSEFFSFLIDTVLFVGQSLPDVARNRQWNDRDELVRDNIQWMIDNLEGHLGEMEAIVLLGHSSYVNDEYFEELARIVSLSEYRDLPFLFIEDNHWFAVEVGFLGAPNLLQIEQEDTVTPLKVTVDTSARALLDVFQYEQGCICTDGHRPTRLIEYNRNHRCSGECDIGFAACEEEDKCSPDGIVCRNG